MPYAHFNKNEDIFIVQLSVIQYNFSFMRQENRMIFDNLMKIDKKYVSEIDSFLQELRRNSPKADSQEAEYAKHEAIAKLRNGEKKDK